MKIIYVFDCGVCQEDRSNGWRHKPRQDFLITPTTWVIYLVPAQQAAKQQKEQDKENAADIEANDLTQTTVTYATTKVQLSQETTKHIPPHLNKLHSKENATS